MSLPPTRGLTFNEWLRSMDVRDVDSTPERRRTLERAYLHLRHSNQGKEGWQHTPGVVNATTGSPAGRPRRHEPGSISGALKARRQAKSALQEQDEPLTKGDYIKAKAAVREATNDPDPTVSLAGQLLSDAMFSGKKPRVALTVLEAAYEAKQAAFGAALNGETAVGEAAEALRAAIRSRSGVVAARRALEDAQKDAIASRAERDRLAALAGPGLDALSGGLDEAAAAAAQIHAFMTAAPPNVIAVLVTAVTVPTLLMACAALAGFTPVTVMLAGVLPGIAVLSIFTTPSVSFAPPSDSGAANAPAEPTGQVAQRPDGYAPLPDAGPGAQPPSPEDPLKASSKRFSATSMIASAGSAVGMSAKQLTPFKRWLARAIQLSMGLTAILSATALFVEPPATIIALAFSVSSLSVQLPDAFGWIFVTGPLASCYKRFRAVGAIHEATDALNRARVEGEEKSRKVTQFVVNFVASTREPLMKLRTAAPHVQDEVADWLPRGGFATSCLRV